MSLLKNFRSFLSNFFFVPVGMLQVSHANFIKSIELYISIEKFEFSIIRGYVFDLEQVPAYSCFIGYVSWQVIISVIRRKRKVLGEISNYKVQLEVVKAKIKSAKSKDESESLKFTQKNLINKMPRFLLLLNISELSLRQVASFLYLRTISQ
nr:uncharacterized protein LOC112702253 isoform X2 [Arachis hypogaea]